MNKGCGEYDVRAKTMKKMMTNSKTKVRTKMMTKKATVVALATRLTIICQSVKGGPVCQAWRLHFYLSTICSLRTP